MKKCDISQKVVRIFVIIGVCSLLSECLASFISLGFRWLTDKVAESPNREQKFKRKKKVAVSKKISSTFK